MQSRTIVFSKIKSAVRKVDKDALIFLFGSRARGDNRPDSDWDFLILTSLSKNKQNIKILKEKIFEAELDLEEPISTIIHNKNDWEKFEITPLYKFIREEGVLI